MPKISVVLPCYNAEQYIAEAISSILSQTYTDFELIIINDGSTDNSENIINSFKDARIKYFANERNLGLARTLNRGIDMAGGEYIARMDSDDISLPERFSRQIAFLEKNQDVGLCGTGMEHFPEQKEIIYVKEKITFLDMLGGCPVAHPTVMIRKSVLNKFDLRYNEDFSCAQDYELWSRLIYCAKIRNIQECLLRYRLHDKNISIAKQQEQRLMAERVKQNILNFLSDNQEMRDKLKKNMMYTKKRIYIFGLQVAKIEYR